MSKKHGCCYVLENATQSKPAVYCGKPTKYTMAKDDDMNKIRKYDPYCPEHREIIDNNPDSDE